MITAKVNVVGNWGQEFAREINKQVGPELAAASEVGARAASDAAASRRRTGRMAEMEVLPVQGSPTGWVGGFRSKAFYAGWQSRGTRKGITPLKFLETGRSTARRDLIERLKKL